MFALRRSRKQLAALGLFFFILKPSFAGFLHPETICLVDAKIKKNLNLGLAVAEEKPFWLQAVCRLFQALLIIACFIYVLITFVLLSVVVVFDCVTFFYFELVNKSFPVLKDAWNTLLSVIKEEHCT